MAEVEMIMPKMGESIIEGTILSWLKQEGDHIEQDESVLEVATDKVDTEVPAINAGILRKILVKEGEVVAVGKPIALIEIKDESETTNEMPVNEEISQKEDLLALSPANTAALVASSAVSQKVLVSENDSRFYSPLVQSIAKKENIYPNELARIPGSGKGGRVTKEDMFAYLKVRRYVPKSIFDVSKSTKVQESSSGEDEIITMDRMRRMIAERMIESKNISAHVTSFVEADLTNLVLWRNKIKDSYKQREGESVTFTPFFVQAIARALKDYPMINISVEGNQIIKKKNINIGIAVALPNGNLIVPVIKNADSYGLDVLSKKINDMAKRARDNKLSPDELSGGTYTLSNVGSFGNIMGTPIIVQPQVAIMAVGTIVKKPAVLETPAGDVIAIRHKVFLSHSYDHRVIDGALGGMFVKQVANYLEDFDLNTVI